jgi:hypothetical protein
MLHPYSGHLMGTGSRLLISVTKANGAAPLAFRVEQNHRIRNAFQTDITFAFLSYLFLGNQRQLFSRGVCKRATAPTARRENLVTHSK